ncbi:helix-turn-helix domain-containing protein [Reinekea thalattae]|uniref:Helix-turn-helix transcriptional regulator n=1 Tax=Reinekea thalattae TaxID=2593301 RepID=A0A5C8Z4B3_9GAMM|nr:helix-turn-helix transcriptional regulator [Reinekea thalattae]TXR52089.1 helix-turn-helix transcriptional regulator [Reinekea thalattae]
MNEPTNVQIINDNAGQPAFAVVPYSEWLKLSAHASDEALIPHEVVEIMVNKNVSLLSAWRRFKKLTQAEMGQRLNTTQAAVAQLEAVGNTPHEATLHRWANALNVSVDALRED